MCRNQGIKVIGFVDNSEEKQQLIIHGKNVISPAALIPGTYKIVIAIGRAHEMEISQQLQGLGLQYGDDFISLRQEILRWYEALYQKMKDSSTVR